jgi:hypothetical protein
MFVADAHRDDGKRFGRANEKLTALVELESTRVFDPPRII